MSFDNSRYPFNPLLDYFGVVMQQGRVQLDSDWNEWVAELAHRLHTGTQDLVGGSGVPATTPYGFNILAYIDSNNVPHITIGAGRIYVDGLLAENHGPAASSSTSNAPQTDLLSLANPTIDYAAQPYLPGIALTSAQVNGKQFLVYLDVWQRDITALQDSNLIDSAVGVDTSGRRQTVWQVKLLDVTGLNFTPATPDGSGAFSISDPATAASIGLTEPSSGALTNGTGGVVLTTSAACAITPATGYTGLENQLYRVQIHQADNVAGTASFKWSRENGSVSTLVTAMTTLATSGATQLTVNSLGPDQVLGFRPGDWIEVIDDVLELSGQSGELHLIESVDPQGKTITLDSAVSTTSFPLTAGLTDPTRHTRVLRWDQAGAIYLSDGSTVWTDLDTTGSSAIPVPPAGTAVSIESGITVAFSTTGTSAKAFQPGDFWTFAARATDGSIQNLAAASPQGVQHHYARLALLDFTSSPPSSIDCRRTFPSLANPSIRVLNVIVGNLPLANDGTATIQSLLGPGGLSVVCDSPIDPHIVVKNVNQNSPICSITLDLPSTASAGTFSPTILPSIVSVGPPNTIVWTHGFDPATNAVSTLEALVPVAPGTPILAHLTLKGSSIWAAGNPNIFLNGTGDGRPSGDYQIWFWLTSQPVATVSVSTIQFPNPQVVGTISDQQTVNLTNNAPAGAAALTLDNITITQVGNTTASTNFALPPNTPTQGSINPGANMSIPVTFTPTATGNLTASLNIFESADGDNSPLVVALSGVGIQPQLTSNTQALSFPVQIVGSSSAIQTVTLSSAGTSQVNITSISVIPPSGVEFIIANQFVLNNLPSIPVALQPGATLPIQVSYQPTIAANDAAQLQIVSSDPNSPILIPLSGSAINGAPVISPSTTTLSFGTVIVQAVSSLALTITNTGNAALTVAGVAVIGAQAANFTNSSNCSTLQPNQSCTITVSFRPAAVGVSTGQLQITHNAAGSPLLINLTGTGFTPKNVITDKGVRKDTKESIKEGIREKIGGIEKVVRTEVLQSIRPAAVVNLEALKAQEDPATATQQSFITPEERPAVGAVPPEPELARESATKPEEPAPSGSQSSEQQSPEQEPPADDGPKNPSQVF
jgi:hypothetical protein